MTNERYDPNAADLANMMLDDVWYGEEDERRRRDHDDVEAGYVDEPTRSALLAWLYHETVRLMHRECAMYSSIDALVEESQTARTGHPQTAPHRVSRRRGRRAAAASAVPP